MKAFPEPQKEMNFSLAHDQELERAAAVLGRSEVRAESSESVTTPHRHCGQDAFLPELLVTPHLEGACLAELLLTWYLRCTAQIEPS